jgi:predicted amidohydrolase YtcJ
MQQFITKRKGHSMLRILAAAILSTSACMPAQNPAAPAELVLHHGVVLTVDAQDNVAQAIAIRAGRIVAVGSDTAIAKLIGPNTKVLDLAGKTVTPGLIDTHAHALFGLTEGLFDLDLSRASSVAQILAEVKTRTANTPPGEWVVGFGWNEGILAEHRGPTLAELDAVTAGHPAFLKNVTHHYGIANSAALAKAGIYTLKQDPAGGTIVRDAAGKPAGLLKEAAQDIILDAIPPPTEAQFHRGVQAVLDRMHAVGLTGVKDIVYPDAWAAYASFARSDGLTAHVCPLMWAGDTLDSAKSTLANIRRAQNEAATIPGHDLTVCGAKILLDGSAMARTAWRYQDYPQTPQQPGAPSRGYPIVDPAHYLSMVKLFTAAGVPVGTHAIGARAIDLTVDSYAAALKETPRIGLRDSIIHAHEPTEHSLAVMQQLQKKYDAGIPEIQSAFMYWLGDSLPAAFGPAQSQHLMPLATYRKLGLLFAGGSDFPVTSLSPAVGLWASVAREPLKGTFGAHPFGTAEAIDIHTALKSYTVWAARQLFLEKETGTIEPGKWADLAVWDRNPYTIPTAQLKDMQCLITVYKGNIVFQQR